MNTELHVGDSIRIKGMKNGVQVRSIGKDGSISYLDDEQRSRVVRPEQCTIFYCPHAKVKSCETDT